jgi:aryl carrier-like protein
MTYSQWRAALDPKVTGTWNLHEVFGTSLDHFILLSSISGTCGERGQVNYSAGNTFQDAFARHRVSQGLPARSINLSTIEDQGYVAENPVIMERMRKDGYQMQTLPELLAILDYAIAHPIPDSIEAAQIVCGAHFPRPKVESSGRRLDARFSHTWTTTQQSNKSTTISHAEHCALLKTVTSLPQAIEVVIAATKSKLARLLDASDDDFDSNRSLSSHGLDSLIAVELRNWIAKELHAPMQMFELMSPMSISELADLISRRSEWIPAAVFQLQD